MLALATLALMAGMFPYTDRGGNQYGPRYYYEAFPLLAIFVVSTLGARLRGGEASPPIGRSTEPTFERTVAPADWSGDAGARRLAGSLAASLVLLVPLAVWHSCNEWRVIRERTDAYRVVARAGLDHAIVLLGGRVGRVRSMAAADLTRNGISWDGPVLYALDRGADNARLAAAYPDRAFFRYVYDRSAGAGHLEPIVSRAGYDIDLQRPPKEAPSP